MMMARGVKVTCDLLSTERHGDRAIGRDAHTVGGGGDATKGPAAAAVTLVTDVGDDLVPGQRSTRLNMF